MKYILVLGLLTLSTVAYGNAYPNELLKSLNSSVIESMFFGKNRLPVTVSKSIPDFDKYNGTLNYILTKVADSAEGPSYKLVKIRSLDMVTSFGDEKVTYSFTVDLQVRNEVKEYCTVNVRAELKEEDGYFLTFMCDGQLIFRQLKPSGEVEAIIPLMIF